MLEIVGIVLIVIAVILMFVNGALMKLMREAHRDYKESTEKILKGSDAHLESCEDLIKAQDEMIEQLKDNIKTYEELRELQDKQIALQNTRIQILETVTGEKTA